MLKRQDGYLLKQIHNKTYLLPFGQNIADQKRGILLNETGEFLWNALETPQEMHSLEEQLIAHYQIPSSDREELHADVAAFVHQLLSLGILREELHCTQNQCCKSMQIADILIHFYGSEQSIPEQFEPFFVENLLESDNTMDDTVAHSEMDIEILSTPPVRHQNGKVLLRNRDMTIHKWEEGYIVFFPEFKNISETYITKDGRYVRIHCSGIFNQAERDNIFHAIRLFFLYHAQIRGYFALHSASILYHEKAWLFSGHSGMGKSTHTALWHELLQTPYLNGDLNLIGIKNGDPVVYGIPWCGTSGIFTTETQELGGIVLLGRDTNDHVKELPVNEKVLRVMQRMISPAWTGELLEKNLEFSEELVELIPVWNLYCTKKDNSVYTIKSVIDKTTT